MATKRKYEFTGETKVVGNVTVQRIRRLTDGKIGGWIEDENNLSHLHTAWVADEAVVYGNAQVVGGGQVYGNARVFGSACVFGGARVCDSAMVYGLARIYGESKIYCDARVYGAAVITEYVHVYENAQICGSVDVRGHVNICGDAQVSGNVVIRDYAHICGATRVSGEARVYDATYLCADVVISSYFNFVHIPGHPYNATLLSDGTVCVCGEIARTIADWQNATTDPYGVANDTQFWWLREKILAMWAVMRKRQRGTQQASAVQLNSSPVPQRRILG